MYNIQNILLPTDCSDYSAAAVEIAVTFAVMYNARLHVLYVAKTPGNVASTPPRPFTENIHVLKHPALADELSSFVDRWMPDQTKVIMALKCGQPYKEIVRYAQEEDIDLIVIATHGRTGLPHLMMGSVAERVVRHSKIPVLTVKPPKLSNIIDLDVFAGSELSAVESQA